MPRGLTGYLSLLLIMNIEYSNEVHKSQIVNLKKNPNNMKGKIVGGSPVRLENFPSMVQLYNLGNMCAGNILNSWAVLTSAHCFDFNTDVAEVVVQVGSRFIYDFNADTYGVTQLVLHDKYNESRNFAYDIALVFLVRPVKFSKTSKKGILATDVKWMNVKELNFTVTGWGWTKYGGHVSSEGLMMTYLRFVPNDKCGQLHSVTLTDDMFCLYGEGIRDTCKGDSGGGVIWHGKIVGITSHGDGCAKRHKPSVYSNVYYFRGWIEKKINEYFDNYCKNNNILRNK